MSNGTSSLMLHKQKLHADNPLVFFECEMKTTPIGRIVMELFAHKVLCVFCAVCVCFVCVLCMFVLYGGEKGERGRTEGS